ncbi:MAG: M15 family metallopeptidase [Alphaproteobacteria bacterium]
MPKLIKSTKQLTPKMQKLESTLRAFAKTQNINYAITETYRSMATISEYYKRGRRGILGEKKITNISPKNAKTKSSHYNRCAFDIVLINKNGRRSYKPLSSFKILGDYWVTLDPLCIWGGNWQRLKDRPHFEHRSYR